MKIKQLKYSILAAVVVSAVSLSPVFAQGQSQRQPRGARQAASEAGQKVTNLNKLVTAKIDFLMQNQEQLQLAEEQVSQLEEIQTQYQQSKDDIESQQEQVGSQLREAVEAEQFEADQVRQLVMEYYTSEQQLATTAVDTMDQLKLMLTSEQEQMVRDMFQPQLEGMFKEGTN
jgi:Spy/CpxP family protein refolding chaperone